MVGRSVGRLVLGWLGRARAAAVYSVWLRIMSEWKEGKWSKLGGEGERERERESEAGTLDVCST